MKTTQAGLARICGVSRSAIWYRVQKGHLRPDKNELLDVTRARRALQRSGSRIIIPYNERELLEIEKLTHELIEKISAEIEKGSYQKVAAHKCGVGERAPFMPEWKKPKVE